MRRRTAQVWLDPSWCSALSRQTSSVPDWQPTQCDTADAQACQLSLAWQARRWRPSATRCQSCASWRHGGCGPGLCSTFLCCDGHLLHTPYTSCSRAEGQYALARRSRALPATQSSSTTSRWPATIAPTHPCVSCLLMDLPTVLLPQPSDDLHVLGSYTHELEEVVTSCGFLAAQEPASARCCAARRPQPCLRHQILPCAHPPFSIFKFLHHTAEVLDPAPQCCCSSSGVFPVATGAAGLEDVLTIELVRLCSLPKLPCN